MSNDLFGHFPPPSKRLPRLPKITGCAADRATDSERRAFMANLMRSGDIAHARELILESRQRVRAVQDEINALRAKRAEIKGQSKAAREQREFIDVEIEALKKKKGELETS